MKFVAHALGAFVVLALLTTGANAAEPIVKCDAAKTKASGKAYAACMKCLNKKFADMGFDEVVCKQVAEDKCVQAFLSADTKGAGGCFNDGNGALRCSETITACETIYTGI